MLDAAKGEGHRSGENPAAWKGVLEFALYKPNELTSKKHHSAIPHAEVAGFKKSREAQTVEARGLVLCVLTVTRSGEVRGAVRPEFDLQKKIWDDPGCPNKAG